MRMKVAGSFTEASSASPSAGTCGLGVAVQRLRALGLGVTGESGNFVLPEFPNVPGKSAADADAFLQSQGMIVRRVENYGLPNYLRITLGTDEEMEAVLNALTQFMGGSDG